MPEKGFAVLAFRPVRKLLNRIDALPPSRGASKPATLLRSIYHIIAPFDNFATACTTHSQGNRFWRGTLSARGHPRFLPRKRPAYILQLSLLLFTVQKAIALTV